MTPGREQLTLLLGIADSRRRESLKRRLTTAGFRIVAPATGPEFQRQAQSGGFRLLVIDPAMTGLEPEAVLKAARGNAGLTLVLGGPLAGTDLNLPADTPAHMLAATITGLQDLLQRLEQAEETTGQLRLTLNEAKEHLDRLEDEKDKEVQRLRRVRQRFHRLIDANPAIIYATSTGREHRNLFVSRRLKEVLGHEPEAMIGNRDFWLEHLHPEDRPGILAQIERLLATGRGSLQYRFRHAEGGWRWIRDDFVVVRDPHGRAVEVVGCWSDITAQVEAVRRSEDLLRAYQMLSTINRATVEIEQADALLEAACRTAVEEGGYRLAWVGLLDEGGHWLVPVAGAGETGYLEGLRVSVREEEPEGRGPSGRAMRSGDAVICEDIESDPHFAPRREAVSRHGLKASIALPLTVEGRIIGTLNLYTIRPERFTGEELALLSEVAGVLAFGLERIDREQRRREAETRLQRLVWHDPLTGLHNRAGFLRAVDGRLREGKSPLALAVFDLARLREVNLSLGYQFGDQLLRVTADRLGEAVVEGEILGHLGASVFALLLPEARTEEGACARLRALLEVLERPFPLEGAEVAVQANVGLALAPRDGHDPETLLRRADLAKEVAKETVEVGLFRPQMEPDPGEHSMLAQLVATLGTDAYQLHYQPKMELATGRIDAVEALVRWRAPTGALASPGRFIPLLERTGLMPRLTPHLLREAARAHSRWLRRGLSIRVAINIAAADVANPALPEILADACARAAITANGLVLELTETSALQERPVVCQRNSKMSPSLQS